jgi:hypothetical protein
LGELLQAGFWISPDGSQIGISLAVGEKKCEFWTVSKHTGESRRVFRATSSFAGPWALPFDWFPDGRYVVFSRRADTRGGI